MKLVGNTMLFMHNNRHLPLTGLLTYFVLREKKTSHETFHEIFRKILHVKKFHEILHH